MLHSAFEIGEHLLSSCVVLIEFLIEPIEAIDDVPEPLEEDGDGDIWLRRLSHGHGKILLTDAICER